VCAVKQVVHIASKLSVTGVHMIYFSISLSHILVKPVIFYLMINIVSTLFVSIKFLYVLIAVIYTVSYESHAII